MELTERTELLSRPRTYDHIPQLGELIKNQGVPGVWYAQTAVANLRPAHERGWGKTLGTNGKPLLPYTIVGNKGVVDCELLSKGTPIPGQDPVSSVSQCGVDDLVYEVAGFTNPKHTNSPEVVTK